MVRKNEKTRKAGSIYRVKMAIKMTYRTFYKFLSRSVIIILLLHTSCSNNINTKYDWYDLENKASTNPNIFASGFVGIQIGKPTNWRFVENVEITKARENIKLKSKDLESKIENTHLPVITIMKYGENENNLKINPTVQVGVRSRKFYGNLTPKTYLKTAINQMKKSPPFNDFRVVEEVRSAKIDDLEAALVVYNYLYESELGLSEQVRSEMWVVMNSINLIIIGMTAPVSGDDSSQEEFSFILSSIKITR